MLSMEMPFERLARKLIWIFFFVSFSGGHSNQCLKKFEGKRQIWWNAIFTRFDKCYQDKVVTDSCPESNHIKNDRNSTNISFDWSNIVTYLQGQKWQFKNSFQCKQFEYVVDSTIFSKNFVGVCFWKFKPVATFESTAKSFDEWCGRKRYQCKELNACQ